MARPVWKGSLSFGLVNIPVGIYPATEDHTLHFHQLEAGTSDRIRYKKVNERTGKEVDATKIERALDLGDGDYVVLSDDELDAAAPTKSRTIDIEGFVELDDVDPIYFRQTYYLAPSSDAATKAYNLLREAMGEAGKVGIARFVMRNKEYLVAIRPEDEVIALETMYFHDEIRQATAELPNLSSNASPTAKERSVAAALIDSLEEEWDPSQYHDEYREQVRELAEQHRKGDGIIHHEEPDDEGGGQVIDLFEALQASVKRSARAATKRSPATAGSKRKRASKPKSAKATKKASTKSTKAPGKKPSQKKARKAS